MYHPFGPNGPYFKRPCQRDRFPSLLDEVGKLADPLVNRFGIPELHNMGARLKRGRGNNGMAEIRAAHSARLAKVEPAAMYAHAYPLVLRRAVDPYMPRFVPVDPAQDPRRPQRRRVNNAPTAARQVGEPPYTGFCYHCRTTGSSDVNSDLSGREMAHNILSNAELFHDHMMEHLVQIRRDNANV